MNTLLRRSALIHSSQAMRNQMIMTQVPQRAILNTIFKAVGFIHTERDKIPTGDKFPVVAQRFPCKVTLEKD